MKEIVDIWVGGRRFTKEITYTNEEDLVSKINAARFTIFQQLEKEKKDVSTN